MWLERLTLWALLLHPNLMYLFRLQRLKRNGWALWVAIYIAAAMLFKKFWSRSLEKTKKADAFSSQVESWRVLAVKNKQRSRSWEFAYLFVVHVIQSLFTMTLYAVLLWTHPYLGRTCRAGYSHVWLGEPLHHGRYKTFYLVGRDRSLSLLSLLKVRCMVVKTWLTRGVLQGDYLQSYWSIRNFSFYVEFQ